MKRFLAVFLLICTLATVLPMGAFATETEEMLFERLPGQCGEDMEWSYDNGTLTISGSGDMDDYPDGDAPWLEYKDSIEKLVVTGNVTSIGACAFLDYDNLKQVDFGSAMHTIQYRAFYSCNGLTTFTLPDTFRKFGEECFMGCESLREIRCLGPMPSFKTSCLWDCPVSVFYPTTNPWPAEYVTPLYQSYLGKIQIFMGDGIEEASKEVTEPVQPQSEATEPAETVPETTEPETTEPETAVPETTESDIVQVSMTEEATEPSTEAVATEAETEPEAVEETQPEETQPKEKKHLGSMNGVVVCAVLFAGVITFLLIGALLFRRRRY